MQVSGRKVIVNGNEWDGVMRSHAVVYVIIEWGDPSAYGKRTRCRFCNKAGLILGQHTTYIDPNMAKLAHEQANAEGLAPDTSEFRRSADAFEEELTREQCSGRSYRGPSRPMCTRCGVELVHRFLSSGRHGAAQYKTTIPTNGWTAFVLRAEPGPDAWWQNTIVTGSGKPSVTKLARFLASQSYSRHQPTLADDLPDGTIINLVGE